MKKNIKSIIATALIGSMLLTSCGTSTSSNTETPAPSQSAEVSESPMADATSEATTEMSDDDYKSEFDNVTPTYTFKLGHAVDEKNTWNLGSLKFAQLVNEKSKGQIKVEVFPSEQLGAELDNIDGIAAGTADMVLSGESLSNWAPSIGMMSAPYLISSSEQLNKVVGGEIGKQFESEIYDKANLKVLTYFERGPRYLTSNKPVNTIDDVNNLKIRIPNVPIFNAVWSAWGARPNPIAFSELFTALQQNTVDAQENPLAMIQSGGFYQVQKYLVDTQHVRSWIYMLIGKNQWEQLSPELQQNMMDAAQEAHDYEHALFLSQEDELFNKLTTTEGMTFVEFDKDALAEKAKEYYEKNLSKEDLAIYESIAAIK